MTNEEHLQQINERLARVETRLQEATAANNNFRISKILKRKKRLETLRDSLEAS